MQGVVQTAVGGKALTQMIEGEKIFDITLRWPEPLRSSVQAILNIPVDITNNQVTAGYVPSVPQTPQTGGSSGISARGHERGHAVEDRQSVRRHAERHQHVAAATLGRPGHSVNEQGEPDPKADFVRTGASTIYREQQHRLIAVKFSVRDRDLAGAVAEARAKTAGLFPPTAPYRAVWSGEFEEMEQAEGRLMLVDPALAGPDFRPAVHGLPLAAGCAGRAVQRARAVDGGHLGPVADGHALQHFGGRGLHLAVRRGDHGRPADDLLLQSASPRRAVRCDEAILQGAEKRLRPMMMTDLTAILGLLPAALALRPAWDAGGAFRWVEQIGSQTQRPLAIVVVGGMITTLLFTRYLMPVLYSFLACARARTAHWQTPERPDRSALESRCDWR